MEYDCITKKGEIGLTWKLEEKSFDLAFTNIDLGNYVTRIDKD